MGPQRDGGPQLMGGLSDSPCLQGFNTEATEILRALRVEVLIATEHMERMCMKMEQFLRATKPTSHLESAF